MKILLHLIIILLIISLSFSCKTSKIKGIGKLHLFTIPTTNNNLWVYQCDSYINKLAIIEELDYRTFLMQIFSKRHNEMKIKVFLNLNDAIMYRCYRKSQNNFTNLIDGILLTDDFKKEKNDN
jgi:hypothetical protein